MGAPMSKSKVLTVAISAVVAIAMTQVTLDAASARNKRHVESGNPAERAFWSGVVPMENGTPVIMRGYHPPKAVPDDTLPQQRADRPVHIPRGSSSFVDIPPVNPSPHGIGPSPQQLMQPPPAPYQPPPINSFGDRVTNAIHDFPLQRGLGNNPNDLQSFIRQRANQP